MKIGILGLEFSGKKSLFSLLTGIKNINYSQQKELLGVVDVPDERVDFLAQKFNSAKKTYTKIEFYLLPSIKKDSQETKKVLTEIKEVDMLAVLLRQFSNTEVFHPLQRINFQEDFNIIKNELIFADLFLIETRLERIEKQMLKNKTDQIVKEKDVLLKLKVSLEKGIFLNRINIDKESFRYIQSLTLLTIKPIFAIINCDDDKLSQEFNLQDGTKSLNISVKIEQEIQDLSETEKKDFLASLGLEESSLNRVIKFAYNYGNLISFLTAGEKESRSWTIKKGTNAQTAAGVIHSDIERGFIRAEVIHFDDFKKAGSESEAKKFGFYRLEGKDYIVKDGDIIFFRFNV
jgi:GTP-binding protein YchF